MTEVTTPMRIPSIRVTQTCKTQEQSKVGAVVTLIDGITLVDLVEYIDIPDDLVI